MREFFQYFFSNGEEGEFRYFSLAHFIPILVLIGIIILIICYRKQIQNSKYEDNIRLTLAFLCILTEMSYFWRLVGVPSLHPNPTDHLPITMCGWGIIFSGFLILTKRQTLFDITYFWLFSGTLFALITPTVITTCGPTRFRYYQFWLEHTLGYIVIFYMMFVHQMRPNVKSIFKSLGALAVLAVVAIFANQMLPGANYLFVAQPEDAPSFLDFLPKNYPLRIAIMGCIVTFLFCLAYLPWWIMDKKEKAMSSNLKEYKEAISK